jgi:biotin carboxylase
MGDRALTIPLCRPEEAAHRIVELAARVPLDAVVAVDDQGVVVAALAAAQLGLAHNPPSAVAATRDKAVMRQRWARAGIAQPEFRLVSSGDPGDSGADVAAAVQAIGPPVVVKPVSLSGSRGVIRADDVAGAVDAAAWARKILAEAGVDPGAPLLIEQFVPGVEVAVEALLRRGRLEALATFDKPDPLDGPYFEETIYVTPSRLPDEWLRRVHAVTAAAAAALGLVEGPVHAELRVHDSGMVRVLELAARSIGGLCTRALRFGAGMSLEQVILHHALDLPLDDLARERAAAGVMMLPIPSEGILRAVHGQEEARAVPGIAGLELCIPLGRPVRPLPEGHRYLGFLFARAESPDQVEQALRVAHARLDVEVAPCASC